MEREYTTDDMLSKIPYKGGSITSKLLNNRPDKRCMKFINLFNVQVE